MKKYLILMIVLAAALFVFAACGGENSNEPTAEPTNAPTAEPTATPEPTPTPTATPEPTPTPTPTPVPEPGTYDLLNFEADEDHFVGDVWSLADGKWSGPLEEPQSGDAGAKVDGMKIYAHREVTAMEGPDGSQIAVIRHAIDADEGYRIGTNHYGLDYVGLKPNTSYRATALIYLGGSIIEGERNEIVFGYAIGLGDVTDPNAIVLEPKDEWQSLEMVFTTGEDVKGSALCLGTRAMTGSINFDYEMCIAEIELYEIVE